MSPATPTLRIDEWDLLFDRGYLKCNKGECENGSGPILWDEHVAGAMNQRLDTLMWWNNTDGVALFVEPFLIHVPTFPTVNLWTEVYIHPTENLNRYMVKWKPYTGADRDAVESVFLMFLNSGEGIHVMREVLIEQMLGQPGWWDDECMSSSHGFQAQMQWEKNLKVTKSAQWWGEHWSVFYDGMCLHCSQNQNNNAFDPDAVPAREGNVW